MKYYLVGIKGNGMSSVCGILQDLNFDCIGSDYDIDYFTKSSLKSRGVEILSFNRQNIKGDRLYIISRAYNRYNNEEVDEIIKKGYKYFYYHEFIEYFFKGIKIGVSGTHGKTTVTSMLSHFLKEKKICSLVGDSTGFGMKDYKYFIFEACEYKNTFLNYTYDYLIINNIDYDHVDFFDSIDDVYKSFQKASKQAKCIIVNGDDLKARMIEHQNKYTFGVNKNNDLILCERKDYKDGQRVVLCTKDKEYVFNLPFKGMHNVYNFMATFLTILILKEDINMDRKLYSYNFPKKRMEIKKYKDNILIDDYAHHPKEIKALIETVKSMYESNRKIAIFQPHTYSRTFKLKDEFIKAFNDCDEVFYVETFTSREGYDLEKEKTVDEIFKRYTKIKISEINRFEKYSNSVILFIGAGIINSDMILKK